MIKSKARFRQVFWAWYEEVTGKQKPRRIRLTQNWLDYDATTRALFTDFLDLSSRAGQVSEKIAKTVTL